MTVIKVSDKVKQELEELKRSGEFKSLDAVIRHYIDSSVIVDGGIFLGSSGSDFITVINVRHGKILNNFSYPHLSPPRTIKLYKCLKCQTTTSQNDCEPVIVPNCGGCGKGMTPITIQIGVPEK